MAWLIRTDEPSDTIGCFCTPVADPAADPAVSQPVHADASAVPTAALTIAAQRCLPAHQLRIQQARAMRA